MNTDPNPTLFDEYLRLARIAAAYQGHDRCLVAPNPELRNRIKVQLDELRGMAGNSVLGARLQVKPTVAPGLNDGLIYPGNMFPLGTPLGVVRSAAADRQPMRGTVRVIVVLAEFTDKPMTASRQHFEDLFFSTGAMPDGSVREYYREVTNGQVDIVGEVVGPYKMPRPIAEYAHGAAGMGPDLPNARTFARDAAVAADADINFSLYDNDHDGFVDAFIVIHAGAGGEASGNSNDIWSHKWVLDGNARAADGVNLYAYLTVPEDCKIGVCCHELGHLLFGFPDLYDTTYASEGVGNWCLMGAGSWNGGGDIPAHPSAWCKANQGWVTVTTQTTSATVTIQDVETSHAIYRLWKDGAGGSEYFLLENRQLTGFDRTLPGAGLLIWHVDESVPGNSDWHHPKVALMQADGNTDLEHSHNRGDAGDPFPGASARDDFDANSTPSSKAYAGSDTCVSVSSIGASGPSMQATLAVSCFVKAKEKEKEGLFDKSKDLKDFKDIINEKWLHKEKFEKEQIEKPADSGAPGGGSSGAGTSGAGGRRAGPGALPGFGGGTSQARSLAAAGPSAVTSQAQGSQKAGPVALGPQAGDLAARVAAIEAHLAVIEPFIAAALRPDLSQGALAGEPDLDQLRQQAQQQAQGAKQTFDTKPREF